jgi:hypothetical protein
LLVEDGAAVVVVGCCVFGMTDCVMSGFVNVTDAELLPVPLLDGAGSDVVSLPLIVTEGLPTGLTVVLLEEALLVELTGGVDIVGLLLKNAVGVLETIGGSRPVGTSPGNEIGPVGGGSRTFST